jgi:hypothetical protein
MSEVARRTVLGWLAGAPLAAGLGTPRLLRAQEHAAEAVAGAAQGHPYAPAFFNENEWQTVRILADLILPADERSGSATDAGVPEFMDFMMNDPAAGDLEKELRQTAMRGGLAWIDAECRRRFGHDFVACSDAERLALLDEIAYPPPEEEDEIDERDPRDLTVVPPRHGPAFFNSFRDLVASGFWSSEMGVRDLDYRGNSAVEWTGPPPEVLRKLGLEP